jgi:hypothetical protein
MASRRWALDRVRRDRSAEIALRSDPETIVRRIIVVDDERTVREAVILGSDSCCSARRKLRDVLTIPPPHDLPTT